MADRIQRHQNQCMAKLTGRMLEKIAAADPTKSPTDPELRRIVAQRLKKMIPNFHTPVHATYAFMIRRAILELNSEAGSDKESISKFMKKEYGDLPLAHECLLASHLTKLCEKGEIFVTDCKRYMLRVMEEDGEPRRLEKNGGGGCNGKGCVLKENEAPEELQKVIVSSKHKNGRNQNGLPWWSSRLQSRKTQEDEMNEHRNELVDDVTKTRGENDATRNQSHRSELSNTDHQSEYQLFDLSDEPSYLKTKIGDEIQDINQQQKPNSVREGSSPNQKPDPETLAVATLSSQAPKPAAIESLSEPLSVCDTTKQKAAAPWNREEVIPTRVPQQNSNSVNDGTLSSGSRSHDKDGTKKRKQIGRPPKIGENKSLKVKRSRVKGCKSICYSDTSIIDLIYSQDHHNQVRPMSRFLGRAKKL